MKTLLDFTPEIEKIRAALGDRAAEKFQEFIINLLVEEELNAKITIMECLYKDLDAALDYIRRNGGQVYRVECVQVGKVASIKYFK